MASLQESEALLDSEEEGNGEREKEREGSQSASLAPFLSFFVCVCVFSSARPAFSSACKRVTSEARDLLCESGSATREREVRARRREIFAPPRTQICCFLDSACFICSLFVWFIPPEKGGLTNLFSSRHILPWKSVRRANCPFAGVHDRVVSACPASSQRWDPYRRPQNPPRPRRRQSRRREITQRPCCRAVSAARNVHLHTPITARAFLFSFFTLD